MTAPAVVPRWPALLACLFLGVGLGAASRLIGSAQTTGTDAPTPPRGEEAPSSPDERVVESDADSERRAAGSSERGGTAPAHSPVESAPAASSTEPSQTSTSTPAGAAPRPGGLGSASLASDRDVCAVRPVGISHAEFVAAVRSGAADAWLVHALEPTSEVMRRRTELNRSAHSVLSQGDFQFLALRYDRDVDTMIGNARGGLNMSSEAYLSMAASMSGTDVRTIDADTRRRFEERLLQYERSRRSILHSAWGAFERSRNTGRAVTIPEFSWIACFSRGDALVVIPPGVDPELDGWIREISGLSQTLRQEIAEILSR